MFESYDQLFPMKNVLFNDLLHNQNTFFVRRMGPSVCLVDLGFHPLITATEIILLININQLFSVFHKFPC